MVWYTASYIYRKTSFVQILIFKWEKIDILIGIARPNFQNLFYYQPAFIFND
jgi:hypothetical protein